MVRHKTRWLLVGLDFESDIVRSSTTKQKTNEKEITKSSMLDKAPVFRELSKSLIKCYGLSAHSIIPDINVRHIGGSKLVMIRVPRDLVGKVRTAITFMKNLDKHAVVGTILSVNGNARTARLAAMREVRKRIDTSTMSQRKLKILNIRFQAIRNME